MTVDEYYHEHEEREDAARAVLAAWDRDTRKWARYIVLPREDHAADESPFARMAANRLGLCLSSPVFAAFHPPAGKSIVFTVPPGLEQELRGRFRL